MTKQHTITKEKKKTIITKKTQTHNIYTIEDDIIGEDEEDEKEVTNRDERTTTASA